MVSFVHADLRLSGVELAENRWRIGRREGRCCKIWEVSVSSPRTEVSWVFLVRQGQSFAQSLPERERRILPDDHSHLSPADVAKYLQSAQTAAIEVSERTDPMGTMN